MSIAMAFIDRYGKEPSFKAAFAAEFFQAEIRSEEDVLRNIIDFAGPTEKSVSQCCNVRRISLDNFIKSGFVTPIELFDETFVVNRVGHDHHIRAPKRQKITENSWKTGEKTGSPTTWGIHTFYRPLQFSGLSEFDGHIGLFPCKVWQFSSEVAAVGGLGKDWTGEF